MVAPMAQNVAFSTLGAPRPSVIVVTFQSEGFAATRTSAKQKKALVLEAFDTLFNKRDYAAAQGFWSDSYIQRSAHMPPGREGLFNLVCNLQFSAELENRLKGKLWWMQQPSDVRQADIALAQRLALEPQQLCQVAATYAPSQIADAVMHVDRSGRDGVVLSDFSSGQGAAS